MIQKTIYEINNEMERQDEKWGQQEHSDEYWLAILGEEFGEVSKAIVEGKAQEIKKELLHVSAVAIQWLDCIARNAAEESEGKCQVKPS